MQMDVTREYDAELVQKYFLEFLTTKKIIYDSRRGIRLTGEQFWSQSSEYLADSKALKDPNCKILFDDKSGDGDYNVVQ